MELAAVVDEAAVGRPAPRRGLGLLPLEAAEMAPDPALALPDERFDPLVGPGPAAARRGWHGHEEAVSAIDAQSQSTSPGRASEDV